MKEKNWIKNKGCPPTTSGFILYNGSRNLSFPKTVHLKNVTGRVIQVASHRGKKKIDYFLFLMNWHPVRCDTGQHSHSPGFMVWQSPRAMPCLTASQAHQHPSPILTDGKTSGKGPATLHHTGWGPLRSCLLTIAQGRGQGMTSLQNTRYRAAAAIQHLPEPWTHV